MVKKRFCEIGSVGRRGGILPGRSRIHARSGVTLVELLVSMLILTLVCISWIKIIGIQSARKEARRREAVERLSGMMDAFQYIYRPRVTEVSEGSYRMVLDKDSNRMYFEYGASTNTVHALFESDVSPIGYQLCIVGRENLPGYASAKKIWNSWGKSWWLVGRLYERNGNVDECGRPFFTLPVCTGIKQ